MKPDQQFEGEIAEGFWFKPVLLEGMDRTKPSYREEYFGPVYQLYKAANDEQAVEIANDNHYGLGSAIFSQDLERAERISERLEAGGTYINELMKTASDLPSGGIKNSGFGRECGQIGLREFTNVKAVTIRKV